MVAIDRRCKTVCHACRAAGGSGCTAHAVRLCDLTSHATLCAAALERAPQSPARTGRLACVQYRASAVARREADACDLRAARGERSALFMQPPHHSFTVKVRLSCCTMPHARGGAGLHVWACTCNTLLCLARFPSRPLHLSRRPQVPSRVLVLVQRRHLESVAAQPRSPYRDQSALSSLHFPPTTRHRAGRSLRLARTRTMTRQRLHPHNNDASITN